MRLTDNPSVPQPGLRGIVEVPQELVSRKDGSRWAIAIVRHRGASPPQAMVLRRPDTGENIWYEPAESLWEDFDPVDQQEKQL